MRSIIVALLALLSGAAALAQSPPPDLQVPAALRPITDNVKGFGVPLMFWMRTAGMTLAAYPNEGAVCITGTLAPDGMLRDMVAAPAEVEETDSVHVVYNCPQNRESVGIGHSHLLQPGEPCYHSQGTDRDTYALEHSFYLFSVVFCSDGIAEVIMQDGRHSNFKWHPSAPLLPPSTSDGPQDGNLSSPRTPLS